MPSTPCPVVRKSGSVPFSTCTRNWPRDGKRLDSQVWSPPERGSRQAFRWLGGEIGRSRCIPKTRCGRSAGQRMTWPADCCPAALTQLEIGRFPSAGDGVAVRLFNPYPTWLRGAGPFAVGIETQGGREPVDSPPGPTAAALERWVPGIASNGDPWGDGGVVPCMECVAARPSR